MKMIVPSYWEHDGSEWSSMITQAGLYPGMIYAIINTAYNGPGWAVEPILLTQVTNFRNAGGKVLGYVNTYDYPTFTPIDEDTVKLHVDRRYILRSGISGRRR